MRRVVCVWLATFATDLVKRRLVRSEGWTSGGQGESRAGWRRRRAIVLTRREGQRELVARRCEVAASSGVREGMDLAHAGSLLAGGVELIKLEHAPEADSRMLRGLARWSLRFSPVCSWDGEDGLVIDTTGTELVHGGETRLLRRIATSMRGLGFAARIASASTVGCAWAVSRYGRYGLSRVPPGCEREAIERLHVASLRIGREAVAGLLELGISTVGKLLALPRSSIAARGFDAGDGCWLVRRIQQALGEVEEYIEPVRPVKAIERELVFDGPTEQWESVESAARDVVAGLVEELASRERGVRRLELTLARAHAPPAKVDLTLSRPSRSLKHLWSLVRARLERVDLVGVHGDGTGNVTGGVEGVSARAVRSEQLRHEQIASEQLGGGGDVEREAEAWGELTDALVSRLGAAHVVLMEPVESHMPERAFRERSVMEARPRARTPACEGAVHPWRYRPPVLLGLPEAARAMALTPDGPVMSLWWRGAWRPVEWCSMAERVGGEWWRGSSGAVADERDYFVVKTRGDGRLLWVFRHAGEGRWFVHGEWS